MLSLEDTVKR